MDITKINPDNIFPNTYNPNVVDPDIMAKLRAEIGQKGLAVPITVRRRGDGAYEIVDGEHRWRICKELGLKEMPCVVQDYNDAEAKIKTIQLNYMRGQVIPYKLAELIYDLDKEITLSDLAQRLPYDEKQLENNLELLNLPADFGVNLETAAAKEAGESMVVHAFVLTPEQTLKLERAIRTASEGTPPETKNAKAVALEVILDKFNAIHLLP